MNLPNSNTPQKASAVNNSPGVRKGVVLGIVIAAVVLLGLQQWRMSKQLAAVEVDRDKMAEQVKSLQERAGSVAPELAQKLEKMEADAAMADTRLSQLAAKATALERQLQSVRPQAQSVQAVAPADSVQPATDPQSLTEYAAVFPKRNHWGPEEVTGPPDTKNEGDIPTAWASWRPDGGPEWLKVDYEVPVQIAEVRIRETYNPGAISKVTAFQGNGQEAVLWEGIPNAAQAPNEFVVSVPASQYVGANQIKIYLDSNRVQGWNEIDAVELVGRDGSRQWAKNASASSTYAEPQQPVTRRGFGTVQFE